MELYVGADSAAGAGALATPPIEPPGAPLPGARRLKRFSDREIERDERRLEARRRAGELLKTAIAGGVDPKLAAVAALVVRSLNVEHCDILQFASDPWVVVARAAWANGNAPSPRRPESPASDLPVETTDARVELIQLSGRTAPLDVLRTEGAVDRIHVFIFSQRQPTPLGILTVQSSTSLRLSVEDRAFLDALGGLIGTAIDSHALRSGGELSKVKHLCTRKRGSHPACVN
jgi:hypothetical protein